MVLNGFNFTGDTDGDTFQYRVDVLRTSDLVSVFTTTTTTWTTDKSKPFDNAPEINIDYTGDLGEEYRLNFTRLNDNTGNERVDIAIDNLSFGQIPEPTSAVLVLFGGLLGFVRRR